MAVFAGSSVSTKVQVVLLAKHESHSPSAARQEIPAMKQLITTWGDAPDSFEADDTETLWQLQTIL